MALMILNPGLQPLDDYFEMMKPTFTETEKDELIRMGLLSDEVDPIPQGILPEYDRDGYDGPLFIYNDVKDT